MYAHEKPAIDLAYRIELAGALCLTCFFFLAVRLWYLQIYQGDHFRILSENNRRKIVFIPPPRGLIKDRNGKVVVKNRPALNIEFVKADSPDPEATINRLAEILGEDPETLRSNLNNQRKRRHYEPQIVLKDVSRDVVAKVVAKGYGLPGVQINHYPARYYVYGDFAAHVIGYIREISRKDLNSPRFAGYRLGDLVGQYGIERKLERFMQGKRGHQEVIVNANGVRIANLSLQSDIPGFAVTLTLDFDVQKAADDALREKRGAIVAMNPNTGEILALSSAPAFDPNMFTKGMSREEWGKLVTGSEKRLNNRAVQGAYPPGSVFKIVMAAAGLAEEVVSKNVQISCPGYLYFGRRPYHCHKRSGHGGMNVHEGLVRSCDVYFYTVGNRLGVDRIHDYATRFGLGSPTQLELVQEHPGLVPSTAWKKRYYSGTEEEKWYPGETLSVSIGQGAMLATPLQMANAVSALINGGKLLRPYLIKEISSNEGSYKDDSDRYEQMGSLDVEPWILEKIKKALIGVANEAGGTARRARLPEELGIQVGGKTGTSQVVALSRKTDDKRFEHHAWYVGFAPADKPEIVVAALVENAGSGGVAAAPLVAQVMEAYFKAAEQTGDNLETDKQAEVS
ncbi:penicillin-binding protein 2 [Oligoflexia bacterium]|nr:penicillin-binding protein 2 [Oligoflexia bacterium]